MFETLLETRARRMRRSTGGTIASVAIHSAMIVGTMAAAAHGGTPPVLVHEPHLIYVTPSTPERRPPAPAPVAPSRGGIPIIGPVPIAPIDVPTGIADPEPARPIDASTVFGSGSPNPGTRTAGDPGGWPTGNEPWTAGLVEKPALSLPGSPVPAYPEMLQRAGVEGEVVAQFVVDTTGRVEPGSFRAIREGHALFVAAVERVLPRMRFVAAEAGGRRVRQLVQQSFVFAIAR